MGEVALCVEERIGAPPQAVFDLFGSGTDAGWLFGSECDRVVEGAAVTLRVPLGGPDSERVELLGHIRSLRSPDSIEVVHHQPWNGRIRLRIDPDGEDGSKVRLIADLDEEGVRWLLRRRGHNPDETDDGRHHKVGLLTSKSGPGSIFASAVENVARMAVTEINADGGLDGLAVKLLVADDQTSPDMGCLEVARLAAAGCSTIIATTTSATFERAEAQLRNSDVLLIHTPMNEGGLQRESLVRLGERPRVQLVAGLEPVMADTGARRWFLAGNDYVWPRALHIEARMILARVKGTIADEAFQVLGTRDFYPLIERIMASGADAVLSTFVGADLVAFERQCSEMGLRSQCTTLAPALDEPTVERIGVAASEGLWAVAGYFATLPGQSNSSFIERYDQQFGRFAPPVSSISESVYEALHLYARATRASNLESCADIANTMRRHRFDLLPGSPVTHEPVLGAPPMHLARVANGRLAVKEAAGV